MKSQNRSLTGFTLIELMVVVCIVGLLASVGLTSFAKYIKMAKTVEAHEALYELRMGAREYYVVDHWNNQGKLTLRQFPQSIKPTPMGGPCCNRCVTPSEEWVTAGWNSLLFSLSEGHHYQYRFLSTGTGFQAVYTAQALGDLDCDKNLSTFEIRGHMDKEGSPVALGPIITNGLE